MLTKTYDVEFFSFKSDSGQEDNGEVEALVSVFDNVDKQGDRVKAGAFSKSLSRWRDSGDPIPMVWNHDWGNPMAHIGYWDPSKSEEVMPVGDRPGGLLLKGRIDVGVGNPIADQVYHLMKNRRVREFSFGYSVPKGGEKKAQDGARDLIELDMVEAGPTLKGVNNSTLLVGVKSENYDTAQLVADTKASILSLGELLSVLEPDTYGAKSDDNDSDEKMSGPVADALKAVEGHLEPLAKKGSKDGKSIVDACQAAIKVLQALSKEFNPKPDKPWDKGKAEDAYRDIEIKRLQDRLLQLTLEVAGESLDFKHAPGPGVGPHYNHPHMFDGHMTGGPTSGGGGVDDKGKPVGGGSTSSGGSQSKKSPIDMSLEEVRAELDKDFPPGTIKNSKDPRFNRYQALQRRRAKLERGLGNSPTNGAGQGGVTNIPAGWVAPPELKQARKDEQAAYEKWRKNPTKENKDALTAAEARVSELMTPKESASAKPKEVKIPAGWVAPPELKQARKDEQAAYEKWRKNPTKENKDALTAAEARVSELMTPKESKPEVAKGWPEVDKQTRLQAQVEAEELWQGGYTPKLSGGSSEDVSGTALGEAMGKDSITPEDLQKYMQDRGQPLPDIQGGYQSDAYSQAQSMYMPLDQDEKQAFLERWKEQNAWDNVIAVDQPDAIEVWDRDSGEVLGNYNYAQARKIAQAKESASNVEPIVPSMSVEDIDAETPEFDSNVPEPRDGKTLADVQAMANELGQPLMEPSGGWVVPSSWSSKEKQIFVNFAPGTTVTTPDGQGTVVDVTPTASDPWATVDVDGIQDEYQVSQLKRVPGKKSMAELQDKVLRLSLDLDL